MVNGRVDTRIDDQRVIIKEIGYHQHTPERIVFWKYKEEPAKCYYHLTDRVNSTCYKLFTVTHREATGSTPTDPAQRPQRPPFRGNLGGSAVPKLQHTSGNQVGDHLINTPDPLPPPPTPPVNDISLTVFQVMHTQEEVEDQNDAFDLIKTNKYNTGPGYYSSLSFT